MAKGPYNLTVVEDAVAFDAECRAVMARVRPELLIASREAKIRNGTCRSADLYRFWEKYLPIISSQARGTRIDSQRLRQTFYRIRDAQDAAQRQALGVPERR